MPKHVRIWQMWQISLTAIAISLIFWLIRIAITPGWNDSMFFILSSFRESPKNEGRPAKALAALGIGKKADSSQFLVHGFSEIGRPSLSFNGLFALFAGQKAVTDPIDVWKISRSPASLKRVVRDCQCMDPVELPDGGIVYTRLLPDAKKRGLMALYTVSAKGTKEQRITFGAASDQSPAILPDGRIVFRRHSFESGQPGKLFAVNPDGAGFELFCEPSPNSSIEGGPWISDDRVVFAESLPDGKRQKLVSVFAHQPMGERKVHLESNQISDLDDDIRSFSWVGQRPQGEWVVSVERKDQNLAFYQFFPDRVSTVEPFLPNVTFSRSGSELYPRSATLMSPRAKPLKLTSVVDEQKSTGTILCLNVYTSRLSALAKSQSAQGIRVFSTDGIWIGEAQIAPDGSFVMNVPANQPLHLELYGSEGVIASDHSGFWVRPNENRGCIGCHEDRELAPENKAPLALTHMGQNKR